MKIKLVSALLIAIAFTGCKKDDDDNPAPVNNTPVVVAAKSFDNVLFDKDKMFFSTEGTSAVALDSNAAKLVPTTIDLTYTWDGGYDAPGMLDPIVRSSNSYGWSSTFHTAWSSVSEEVIWYKTTLVAQDFTNAKADKSKIDEYFADGKTTITTHTIWPTGACVGGRNGNTGLGVGQIFAFERSSDSKKGLIQIVSTFTMGINTQTKMNIIIEN